MILVGSGDDGERGTVSRLIGTASGYSLLPSVVDVIGVAAFVPHSRLPILYVISSSSHEMQAVRLDSAAPHITSRGALPPGACNLAVNSAGDELATVHYEPGGVTTRALGRDGGLGKAHWVSWPGSGVDTHRQEASHPHSASYESGRLTVADLGSDCLWIRARSHPSAAAPEWTRHALPPGSGPRHQAFVDPHRLLVSGELDRSLMMVDLASETTTSVPSSALARSSAGPNYPGDVQYDHRRRVAIIANRGLDTLAIFRVDASGFRLVDEVATPEWPQHILITGDHVLVACQHADVVAVYVWTRDSTLRLTQEIKLDAPTWLARTDEPGDHRSR